MCFLWCIGGRWMIFEAVYELSMKFLLWSVDRLPRYVILRCPLLYLNGELEEYWMFLIIMSFMDGRTITNVIKVCKPAQGIAVQRYLYISSFYIPLTPKSPFFPPRTLCPTRLTFTFTYDPILFSANGNFEKLKIPRLPCLTGRLTLLPPLVQFWAPNKARQLIHCVCMYVMTE